MRKPYVFFRYDLPRGLRNLIRFSGVVWRFRSWDYEYTLDLFRAGLKELYKNILIGTEVDESRIPKTEAMRRVLAILDRTEEQKTEAMRRVLALLDRTEEHRYESLFASNEAKQKMCQEWNEIWQIIAGSDNIPGSDMRGWWD
jgi:hypothetical protein